LSFVSHANAASETAAVLRVLVEQPAIPKTTIAKGAFARRIADVNLPEGHVHCVQPGRDDGGQDGIKA
jgi:hypothetical protein